MKQYCVINKMTYSEEEIKKYLNIKIPEKVSCENCGNTHFFKDHGFRYCSNCFYFVGRVFIKDVTSKDRCHFQKKSVYKRSYRYQNKLEEISKKYNLDIRPEAHYKLRLDLEKIDKKLNKINDTYQRKRLINITYLIKRILSEYDKSEADKIQLKRSDKTLKFYDDWYKTYESFQ